ncbi:SH3 domain-containing protein [Streptomyces sp. NPDC048309]|uniref:SH3 domain-containing protein n=1 Tax=Streptomyces sp. NPDC048309 TaxID=3154618 RepID=UPI0033F13036
MIRRTLRNGLVAVVAAVAFFPVTAVASAAPAEVTAVAPAALAAHVPSWATPVSTPSWYPTIPQSALPGHPGARHILPKTPKHHARRHVATHVRHHVAAPAWRHTRTHARRHVVRHTRHHLASHTWGRVTTHHLRLNVRSGPGTGYRVIGSRPIGHVMGITCKKRGSSVQGNRHWYKLAHHKGYVSARYVHNRSAVRWC